MDLRSLFEGLLIAVIIILCWRSWVGEKDQKSMDQQYYQDISILKGKGDSLERISEVYRHEIKHLYTLREQLLQQKDSLITAYKAKPPRARIAVLAQISPKIVNLGDTAAYVPLIAVDSINVLRDHLTIANKGLLVADSIILVQEGKISNDSLQLVNQKQVSGKWKKWAEKKDKEATRARWLARISIGALIMAGVAALF